MTTVLVCVRTPLSARLVAATAERLGVAAAVRVAVSAGEAMKQLAGWAADIVVADTAVTRPDSARFARHVLARAPQARIVFLGGEDPRAATAAIAAGALGVIRGVDHDVVSVVARVLLLLTAANRQERPVCEPLPELPAVRPALSDRELQVLRAMADGMSNAEIGREIHVAEDTVKTHARRIFRKLDARDRAHAVATGFRLGLVA